MNIPSRIQRRRCCGWCARAAIENGIATAYRKAQDRSVDQVTATLEPIEANSQTRNEVEEVAVALLCSRLLVRLVSLALVGRRVL
jgi:hypothetical protein